LTVFLISFVTITNLTFFSFLAAFGRDEGTLEKNDGFIKNLLADSFNVFSLPTHGLFTDKAIMTATKVYGGLVLNAILWALLIERLIFLIQLLLTKFKVMIENNVR
jgi:hypothetical protein